MPRFLSSFLGALALLMATAMVVTQGVFSQHIDRDSLGRAASVVSAILEALLLIDVLYLSAPIFVPSIRVQSKWGLWAAFGLGLLLCTVATATSIVALAYSKRTATAQRMPSGLITACAVIVVFSLLSHLFFLVVSFLTARTEGVGATSWTFNKDEESGLRSRRLNIKAIRYSQTLPIMNESQRNTADLEPLASPKSLSCRSTFDTTRLSLSSTSQTIRPISSTTSKLLPPKELERGLSLECNTNRGSGSDNAFDSWDLSAFDLHGRPAVLEISSPTQSKTRGLETIPASPVPSRSPSPQSLSDLEPPFLQNRSRSYSPVSIDRERLPRPSTPGANSEAHIHPLFRSDSPDPHPLATPGTSVVASPDAGRVIVHRASNRSLSRMRSGSLPVVRSPLSKPGSFEESRSLRHHQLGEPEFAVAHAETEPRPRTERITTPPIPDWILAAGLGTR